MQYAVTPSESLNRVEIYVEGKQIKNDPDIKLRFNNKEKIKQNYFAAIMFCFGVSVTLFFTGLLGAKSKA